MALSDEQVLSLGLPIVRILTEHRQPDDSVHETIPLGVIPADLGRFSQLLEEDLEDWYITLEVVTASDKTSEDVDSESVLDLVGSLQGYLTSSAEGSETRSAGVIHAVQTIIPLLFLHFVLFDDNDSFESLDRCIGVARDFLSDHPDRYGPDIHAEVSRELGSCLQIRFQLVSGEGRDGNKDTLLDEAVGSYRESVCVYPRSNVAGRARALRDLAIALWVRFEARGNLDGELDGIVDAWREYATIAPAEVDIVTMVNFGSALGARHDLQTHSMHDVDEAVTWHRAAYLSKDPEQHLVAVRVYVTSLWQRYQREETMEDLEQLVELLREELALDEEAHMDRAMALNRLAICLLAKMVKQIALDTPLDTLEEAVDLHEQALVIIPPEHDEHAVALSNLGQVYRFRYQLTASPQDLSTCISYQERTLEKRPPGHSRRFTSLFYLSESLGWEASVSGDHAVAERAVSLIEEAIRRESGHDGADVDTQLLYAAALRTRGTIDESKPDLDKAVDVCRAALKPPPFVLATHIDALHGLVTCLRYRYHVFPNTFDLNDAITQLHRILEICPSNSPNLWVFTSNLAGLLRMRADVSNSLDDLQGATELTKRAHTLCPSGHRLSSSSLFNYALAVRQDLTGSPSTQILKDAISLQRRALKAIDPHDPGRWYQSSQLGVSFLTLYATEKPTNPSHLQDALNSLREALSQCPDSGYDRADILCDIGSALCSPIISNPSVEESGEKLEEAMNMHLQATEILPSGHPRHIPITSPFASRVFLAQYLVHKEEGDFLIAARAVLDFVRCNRLGIPVRLKLATQWLSTGFIRDNVATLDVVKRTASNIYDEVMELLPRLAYLGQDPKSRLEAIGLAPEMTRSAAQHAIAMGSLEKAVEYIEHGRSIFWSQALRLRTPIDQLKDQSPELYEQMSAKLRELEMENYWEPSSTKTWETEEKLSLIQRLTDEFEELLEKARRTVSGAEDFMRPKRFQQISAALQHRVVVILIPLGEHYDALVLRSGSVIRVRLAAVSPAVVQRLADDVAKIFRDSAATAGLGKGYGIETERAGKKGGTGGLDGVLSQLWTNVVKPILDKLKYKRSSGHDRPRLWWCPIGDAVFLPLHAAGRYKGRATDCTSDYVVSSYITSLGTLADVIASEVQARTADAKVLLLSQPQARRQRQLYNTASELQRIANVAPQESLLYLGSQSTLDLKGEHTTTKNVLSVFPEATILHLACHGLQDPDDPLASGFEMQDGRLTVLQLMQFKMPRAFFAFLSACQSASGSKELPDETVGLASTMLFVGFRSVIGTMWSMADVDGPEVAETVYKELFKTDSLDAESIPYALDAAVRELRRKGVGATRWACYIHVGL